MYFVVPYCSDYGFTTPPRQIKVLSGFWKRIRIYFQPESDVITKSYWWYYSTQYPDSIIAQADVGWVKWIMLIWALRQAFFGESWLRI